MKKMKAMRLTSIRKMEMLEVDKPQITAGNDVLIKMTDVGVCGSDVYYYSRGKIGSQVVKYPFTVGHEGSGIVEAVGAKRLGLPPPAERVPEHRQEQQVEQEPNDDADADTLAAPPALLVPVDILMLFIGTGVEDDNERKCGKSYYAEQTLIQPEPEDDWAA